MRALRCNVCCHGWRGPCPCYCGGGLLGFESACGGARLTINSRWRLRLALGLRRLGVLAWSGLRPRADRSRHRQCSRRAARGVGTGKLMPSSTWRKERVARWRRRSTGMRMNLVAIGRMPRRGFLHDGDTQRHIDLARPARGPTITRPSTPIRITMLPPTTAQSRAARMNYPGTSPSSPTCRRAAPMVSVEAPWRTSTRRAIDVGCGRSACCGLADEPGEEVDERAGPESRASSAGAAGGRGRRAGARARKSASKSAPATSARPHLASDRPRHSPAHRSTPMPLLYQANRGHPKAARRVVKADCTKGIPMLD